eukprot:m.739589 g.739589  ORF g.739589 m.739589 type:complete len:1088 (+) comp23108_c0_seq1:176-3439(+)
MSSPTDIHVHIVQPTEAQMDSTTDVSSQSKSPHAFDSACTTAWEGVDAMPIGRAFRLANHELADNIAFYRERVSRRVQHDKNLGSGMGSDWSVVSGVTSTVSDVTKTCLEVACRTGNGRDDDDNEDDDSSITSMKSSTTHTTTTSSTESKVVGGGERQSTDEKIIPSSSNTLLLHTFEQAATTLQEIEPLTLQMAHAGTKHDFSTTIRGNGYWAFCRVVQTVVEEIQLIAQKCTEGRRDLFFTPYAIIAQMQQCADELLRRALHPLVVLLLELDQLGSDSHPSLFAVHAKATELVDNAGKTVDRHVFFGKFVGFMHMPEIRTIVTAIVSAMAVYSTMYTAWYDGWTAGRCLIDAETRGAHIMSLFRADDGIDPEFLQAFWALSENTIIYKGASALATPVEVLCAFRIPATTLTYRGLTLRIGQLQMGRRGRHRTLGTLPPVAARVASGLSAGTHALTESLTGRSDRRLDEDADACIQEVHASDDGDGSGDMGTGNGSSGADNDNDNEADDGIAEDRALQAWQAALSQADGAVFRAAAGVFVGGAHATQHDANADSDSEADADADTDTPSSALRGNPVVADTTRTIRSEIQFHDEEERGMGDWVAVNPAVPMHEFQPNRSPARSIDGHSSTSGLSQILSGGDGAGAEAAQEDAEFVEVTVFGTQGDGHKTTTTSSHVCESMRVATEDMVQIVNSTWKTLTGLVGAVSVKSKAARDGGSSADADDFEVVDMSFSGQRCYKASQQREQDSRRAGDVAETGNDDNALPQTPPPRTPPTPSRPPSDYDKLEDFNADDIPHFEGVNVTLISHRTRQGMVRGEQLDDTAPDGVCPSRGLVLHLHGGGFVSSTSKTHMGYLRAWAAALDTPVLSVDYSLAPQYPYPHALNECFYVYAWALTHAELLGWSGERICITGDSAGGNLAVAVALKCHQECLRPPDGISIFYPALSVGEAVSPSRVMSLMDPLLPREILMSCLRAYVGKAPHIDPSELVPERLSSTKDHDPMDPLLSPLFADDALLRTLPPISIAAVLLDPLLDDSIEFAKRLRIVGNPVRLHVYDELSHGFLMFADISDTSRAAADTAVQWIKEVFDGF